MDSPDEQQLTAVVLGVQKGMRGRLEAAVGHANRVFLVPTVRDGWLELGLPAHMVQADLAQAFQLATLPQGLLVIVPPYFRVPDSVEETLTVLESLGCIVSRPSSNADGWPATPKKFDAAFNDALYSAMSTALKAHFGVVEEQVKDPDEEIISELLRGLATHTKMGPNNHSHEDDLWKSRGRALKPNERHRIVRGMMRDKLIDRKKNDSMGGTGWVYWIDDVALVRQRFPELAPYLE